jgi:hypothetical protein
MKERDYINATNLAKLRLAKIAVSDTLDMDPEETKLRRAALVAMHTWETKLENVVKTS